MPVYEERIPVYEDRAATTTVSDNSSMAMLTMILIGLLVIVLALIIVFHGIMHLF